MIRAQERHLAVLAGEPRRADDVLLPRARTREDEQRSRGTFRRVTDRVVDDLHRQGLSAVQIIAATGFRPTDVYGGLHRGAPPSCQSEDYLHDAVATAVNVVRFVTGDRLQGGLARQAHDALWLLRERVQDWRATWIVHVSQGRTGRPLWARQAEVEAGALDQLQDELELKL